MGYSDPFLLGVAGRLMEMPSPVADGFDAPYERTAAKHRSMTGGTTVDVLGAHRSWAFRFSYRHGGEAARLIARWTSPITTEPLRLVDPLTANRLSLDAASGGGVTGTAESIAVSTGNAHRITPDTMPPELDGLLDGALHWSAADSGTASLDNTDGVPFVPGEPVAFRVWLRGDARVRLILRYLDRHGDALAASVGDELDLAWDWGTQSIARTVPDDCALVVPAVQTRDGGGPVELTGPLLTADPDAAGEWSPGGGAPVVNLTEFTHGYQRLGRREMNLTVQEA